MIAVTTLALHPNNVSAIVFGIVAGLTQNTLCKRARGQRGPSTMFMKRDIKFNQTPRPRQFSTRTRARKCKLEAAMANEQELAQLVEELRRRVADLEQKAQPPKKFVSDYVPPSPFAALDRASMSPEAMRDLVNGVDEGLMAGLRADARRPNAGPTTMLAQSSTGLSVAALNKSGWRDAAPLGVPGGDSTQALIAGLCDEMLGPGASKLAQIRKGLLALQPLLKDEAQQRRIIDALKQLDELEGRIKK
jgi:hypothetical protein